MRRLSPRILRHVLFRARLMPRLASCWTQHLSRSCFGTITNGAIPAVLSTSSSTWLRKTQKRSTLNRDGQQYTRASYLLPSFISLPSLCPEGPDCIGQIFVSVD